MGLSYTYSTIFVRELLAAMEANGAERLELFQRTGLRKSMLRNPLGRVQHEYVELLFEVASELVPHPDWGLRIARYLSENSQRLTTLILFTAPSIRAGLRRARRFQHLNTTRGYFTLQDDESDPLVRCPLHMPGLSNEGAGRHMIEATIGAIALYVDRFAGDDAIPGYVSFRHEAQMPLAIYEKFFPGRELRFGADTDELSYLRENLDKHSPLAIYNHQIHEAIAGQAEAIYQQLLGSPDIENDVRLVLKQQLEECPEDISLESVAEALKLAGRTLQRKLNRGGISFNDLADDERRSLFRSLVTNEEMSFSELGRRCGFRSRESLYRSVKRWYGVTPSEYRARMH